MKSSEKAIVFGVLVAALALSFYLLLLAPKRQQASDLNDQIDQLHGSISQQQQVATFAGQARKDFPRYYGRLVVLGKAVPQQADTASMLVQLNSISSQNHIDFRSIVLGSDSGSAGTGTSTSSSSTSPATSTSGTASSGTSTAPTPSADSTSTASSGASTSTSGSAASTAPAPATETSAASLPLGATVGTAGLATLPYTLKFTGGFFDISNFIGGVDDLVQPTDGAVRVSPDGRLFTVDGFALSGGAPGSSPKLNATFSVTTYATPGTQGLTLGASPSGPAPAVPGGVQAEPASAVVAK